MGYRPPGKLYICRSRWGRLVFCLLSVMTCSLGASAQGAAPAMPLRIEDLVRSEVIVIAGQSVFAGVVTSPGKVATLCHRLAGAPSIDVQSISGQRYAARLVAADQDRNVCILQAENPTADIEQPARHAESSDQTKAVGVLLSHHGQFRLGVLHVSYLGMVVGGTYLALKSPVLSNESFGVVDGSGVYDGQGRLIGMASTDASGPLPLTMALPVEWLAHVEDKMPPPELPLIATAWMNQARASDARGDKAALMQNNLRWTTERPQSAWAWNNLGNAHMFSNEAGKVEKGRAAYERAVEIDPRLVTAWSNLGNAHAANRNTVRAVDAYRNALRIDPAYGAAWKNLAKLYRETGQMANAVTTLKLAASAGKGRLRAGALNDLALIQTNPLEAAETLRMALQETPDDALLWNSLGSKLYDAGELDKAIRAYEVAVRAAPGFPGPWANLGKTYVKAKQPEAALRAYRMATATDPTYGVGWKWQGVLLADHERDFKRAIAAYLEASKNGEDGADLWSALGVAYQHDGQADQAQAAYRKAIEREPKATLHLTRLGWLHMLQGKLGDAGLAAQEALKLNPFDTHPGV